MRKEYPDEDFAGNREIQLFRVFTTQEMSFSDFRVLDIKSFPGGRGRIRSELTQGVRRVQVDFFR